MSCSSSCPTPGAHASWGECVRSKALHTLVGEGHARTAAWDSDLDLYAKARREGIQPAGTKRAQVEAAFAASKATGKPFDASGGQGVA